MREYVKPTMLCIAIRPEESIAADSGGSATCIYVSHDDGNCVPGYYGLNG